MDCSGGHRLARPRFSQQQHRRPCVGNAFDQVEHFQHAIVVADDISEAAALIEGPFELLAVTRDLLLAKCSTNREIEFFLDNRLCQIVKRAVTNGVHCTFDRPKSG